MAKCKELRSYVAKDSFVWLEGGEDWDSRYVGKWMLFVGCADAQRVWETICSSGFQAAKISAQEKPGDPHVICVYTRDFRDVDDVDAVATKLAKTFGLSEAIFYKPDAFTYEYLSGSIFGLRKGRVFATKKLQLLPKKDRDAIERALKMRAQP